MQQPQYVSYENYNVTSHNYDKSRRAIGLDRIEEALNSVAAKKGVQVKDLILLDAGCGSGNYTGHLYGKVKKYIGVEFNEGMASKFKTKYQNIDNIELVQKSVWETGLNDEIADVIIMNQVIHHLDGQNKERTDFCGEEFPNITKTMKELFRLLKKGGAISINFTPVEQMFGLWYIKHLHPKEKTEAAWNKLCPNVEKMTRILSDIGFNQQKYDKVPEPFMYKDIYLQLEGPFSKEFRDGDSFWGLITAKEQEECLENLKQILSGDIDKFKKQVEQELEEIGQSTTVTAFKV